MSNPVIGVIGLGYVGLPLASLFATKHKVIGFDINNQRVQELKGGLDKTLEVEDSTLKEVLVADRNVEKGLFVTSAEDALEGCDYFIITVPTSVDKNNQPILGPLLAASGTVARWIKKGGVVIYESTVYPGATEEDCIPVVEKESKLVFNRDFFVGYSPERISPGDKVRTVENILKVTSGSTPEIAIKIDQLYKSVIKAGTYMASSIKVAEASKIIENCQRDINIAFVNELAKIFNLLEIDTGEVLKAAATKWNFLPFKPGLVGGHCIGVDPYYLAQKAQSKGYHPEIILAGRRLNDGMGEYVATEVVKLMIQHDILVRNAKVLVLGVTFKENCPDVRNTKVVDLVRGLKGFGTDVVVYDPWARAEDVQAEFGMVLSPRVPDVKFDAVVLAVAHSEFEKMDLGLYREENSVVYDVKGTWSSEVVDARL